MPSSKTCCRGAPERARPHIARCTARAIICKDARLYPGQAGWAAQLLAALCLSLATAAGAQEAGSASLHFERAPPPGTTLNFRHDDALSAARGDFVLLDYLAMSNDFGERWALLSVRNSSSGARLLQNEHFVATFANGDQAHALNVRERLPGNTVYTQAVYFGFHKFPIVRIEMRPRPGAAQQPVR